MPDLGLAGRRGAGAVGARRAARPRASTSATTLSMSSAGMCSVMQKMVPMPASSGLEDRVGRAGGGDVDDARVGARRAPPPRRTVSKTGTAPVERASGRPCRASRRPRRWCRSPASGWAWNPPSRPVMPWTRRRVSPVDEDAHAAARPPAATRPPLDRTRSTASSSAWARRRSSSPASRRMRRGQLGVRAHDAHHHGHVAAPARARASTSPRATSSPRAMPPKMLTRMARTIGSARMSRIAAATLSARAPPPMSRKLAGCAAGALDEVHRRHRQPGAVDHAADGAVEPDEAEARGSRLDIDRVLLVEVAHGLQRRVAGERRVVEGHLGVEAAPARSTRRRRPSARGRWPAG